VTAGFPARAGQRAGILTDNDAVTCDETGAEGSRGGGQRENETMEKPVDLARSDAPQRDRPLFVAINHTASQKRNANQIAEMLSSDQNAGSETADSI
jgi:hypothetical protein